MHCVADAGTVINSDNNDVTMGATRFRLVQHNCVITRLQIKRAAESVGMRNIMGLRYLSDVWSPYDDSFYNELDEFDFGTKLYCKFNGRGM
mgnify:CR=1 FL=1